MSWMWSFFKLKDWLTEANSLFIDFKPHWFRKGVSMTSKITSIMVGLGILMLMLSIPAFAEGPDFSNPAIYADGEMWATKGLGPLPAPNGKNNQSFDFLFIFNNGAEGQLPVAEAAPRNRHYNGGRWNAYSAEWQGDIANDPPVVMSYAELSGYVADGDLTISHSGLYFECPLLPLKGNR